MKPMTDTPNITVPPGWELQEDANGALALVQVGAGDRLRHTFSFRITPANRARLALFIESFPDHKSGTAFRWLLNDPRVVEVMNERISAQTRRVR